MAAAGDEGEETEREHGMVQGCSEELPNRSLPAGVIGRETFLLSLVIVEVRWYSA